VDYQYGTTAPHVGRLTRVHSGGQSTEYGYDALGRVVTSLQTTAGQTYSFSYEYNKGGTLKKQTYPSNRQVTYTYDDAARISLVQGLLTQVSKDYATSFAYAPHGAASQMTLGNGIVETTQFNSRLQPTQIQAGSLLTLGFAYGTSNNNGNVLSQSITRPGVAALNQTYSYDGVNRLATAAEGSNWSRTYTYNAWSNRAVTVNTGLPVSPLMPTALAAFSTATNRITAGGTIHDNAGNLTLDTIGQQFTYDAENRQTSYLDPATSGTTSYIYDGEGRRVQKLLPGGATTVFVYDAFGNLAAEYSTVEPANDGTFFRTTDHLGSTRLETDANGDATWCRDYAPFGEEIPSSVGSRSGTGCYGSSFAFAQKFTGKERDGESGLDYFLARYMSSPQGRFTSPDPLVWQSWQTGNEEEQGRFREFISNPQNFNLYTYGLNNPLKYNDPTGLDVEIAISFVGDISDEEKRRIISAVTSYYQGLKVGNVVVRDTADSSQDKRTFGQKLKDFFTKDYQSITVDLAHANPFGNNADRPDFVKAFNMARTGDPGDFFGDLRKSDPTQWSNIIAWRILHETISHGLGIGPDNDQLVQVGGPRAGTLIQGSYGRGRPGIPPLNPSDTRAIQQLLIPRTRSYVK
jgi:RHS repeat-associated protein